MGLTGEEIRHRLTAFAARWDNYAGSERSEAQTFLNQLFDCYGQDRQECGARFEEPQKGKFLDLIWPGVCIIEMKGPAEAKRLAKHRTQAFDYWEHSDDADKGIRRPRWVVLCAFNKLEVWEPGAFSKPHAVIDLVDLPDQADALGFLAGHEPTFVGNQATVTREAVALVSDVYSQLRERRAADREVLRDFILQSVWCMFAEDLGMIPRKGFTTILHGAIDDSRRSTADELGRLFEWLNTPESEPRHGMYEGIPYANGGLFKKPARVHLEPSEAKMLYSAARDYNWRKVQPTIFGSLLEGGLGHDKQWHLGAHYTHEADIQKIVQPTIVQPWVERIENITKHAEAVAAQNELMSYVVLDPACGSGNFLYVAYQELRRIEKRLGERETELRRKTGMKQQEALSLFFPLSNMKGIEIDGFAVALARVTLWMGHKLAVDELDIAEQTLPLADLTGIKQGHALREPWPKANAIIGNPPFHGSQNLRGEVGDAEIEWLKREFKVGVKDYCVYWFRKAHDHLETGERAGLVATNSVSQNRMRGASLDYIVENGGIITDAVSTQDWPGEAAVDVSIVNWIKSPSLVPANFLLDGESVDGITTSLRGAGSEVADASILTANRGRSFQGPKPVGKGFIIEADLATTLLDADDRNRDVVRPYLVGADIAGRSDQSASRWCIDFGMLPLEGAMQYPAVLETLRDRLAQDDPEKQRSRANLPWWRFERPRPAMRGALDGMCRYIGGTATGKRILFAWADAGTCPSNAMNVFAFSDDYSFGVLNCCAHLEWARAQSSTLEDRIRYTPTSAFETFPWPQPDDAARERIGDIAKRLDERRRAICREKQIGLTTLYNQMDDGAWADLKKLHRALDEAVAEAYGWPKSVAHDADESNRRLLELNRAIAAGEVEYEPFAYLGGVS